MRPDTLLLTMLFTHYIADFVMQTDWQATNKSTNNDALLKHTLTYSAVWFLVMCFMGLHTYTLIGSIVVSILFSTLTFILHTCTDYVTSRFVKRFFDKKDYHNGFLVIGFDQILHYLQLYYLLSNLY